jgi:hypothetical protein
LKMSGGERNASDHHHHRHNDAGKPCFSSHSSSVFPRRSGHLSMMRDSHRHAKASSRVSTATWPLAALGFL